LKIVIKLILGVFILSITHFNCIDKENNKCEVKCDSIRTAPKNLMDYFIFNKGSYWVYKLQGTDTIDTLTFGGYNENYFEIKASCNYGISPCQKSYRLAFKHSNFQKFPPATSFGTSQESYSLEFRIGLNQWIISHHSENGGGGTLGYFLAYPFKINQQYEEFRFLRDTSSNITVPAGKFECLETEMRPKPKYAGFYQSMYFAKRIGLIKYELSANNNIWELVNYDLK
jgi:hypothetical protein